MAPTEFDKQELAHHIAQARKLLAKMKLPLPESSVDRAIAELLVPWKQAPSPKAENGPWRATFETDHGTALLLQVFKDKDGLWQGLVELKYQMGPDWRSPSPFATADLAKQWAEGQAEKLRDLR